MCVFVCVCSCVTSCAMERSRENSGSLSSICEPFCSFKKTKKLSQFHSRVFVCEDCMYVCVGVFVSGTGRKRESKFTYISSLVSSSAALSIQ